MTTRPTVTRRLRALAAVLLLAAAVVGCGGDAADVQADPKAALVAGVEAIGGWEGITLDVRLEADDAGRAELLGEGGLGEVELDVLLDASLALSVHGDDDAGGMELALRLGGDTAAELRITEDERFFVRADLAVLSRLDADGTLAADLDELVAAASFLGLADAAQALVAGRWIEVAGLDMLADLAGPGTPEPPEEPGFADALARLSERAVAFLDADVSVTYLGSEPAGERVRATVDVAALERFLRDAVTELDTTGAAGGLGGEMLGDLGGSGSVSLDAWIRDGELSQLAFDVTDLPGEAAAGEIRIVIGVEEFRGSITAPTDAVSIDLFGLLGGFLGGFGADPFGDDLFGDEGFDEGPVGDDGFGDDECITEAELDEIETFLGEDARADIEALIDAGMLARC